MKNKRILGIDYGIKYIGIAISDNENKFALPYKVIENNKNFIDELIKIVYQDSINIIVIGYPKTFNNYISQRHKLIEEFAEMISDKIANVEIILQDEAYTTKMATFLQKQVGIKNSKIKKTKDMSSAALILDAYIEKHFNKSIK